MQSQTAQLSWSDDEVPRSRRFDDPYYSLQDGLAETQHVFLAGNDLPKRFVPGFHVAELGFGTGLNFLATLAAWQSVGAPAPLTFTSFEAYPMQRADMARALGRFEALGPLCARLLAVWQEQNAALGGRIEVVEGAVLELICGDARTALPEWKGAADAWYLDGFAPAKNPELWEPELLRQVAGHTRPGGTAASYCAAGAVRRALAAAGFEVTRCAGFGTKRHMTRAALPR